MERNVAGSEYPEISVERKNVIGFAEGHRGTDGDRFLADAGEPFAQLSLTEKDEHLFFDHPGEKNAFEQPEK